MAAQTPRALFVSVRGSSRRGARQLDFRLLLGLVLAVGAGNFFWQLGSSSYFVDEVLSIQHALPSLGMVNHLVTHTESTPWTFFWGLHFWLHLTGSQNEWVTRLPSALAGIVLVAAVFWMARGLLDRPGALIAAALTALSPLVLTYAQQVRVYVFAMLVLTIMVGLTIRAARDPARSRRLLFAGAAMAVLAIWLHYTAILVVAPLCVWLAMQWTLPLRTRGTFVGICTLGIAIELPLLLRQYHYSPNGGLGPGASIRPVSVIQVLETPFDGRYYAEVNGFRIVGLIVVVLAMAVLVVRASDRVREPRLLLALGVTAPLVILVLGIAGKDVVISRYTAVAAPMLLTGIAAAIVALPRLPATALTALTATAAVWGLTQIHRTANFYAPAREALAFIQAHQLPGSVVVIPVSPGAAIPLGYYAPLILHPVASFVLGTDRRSIMRLLRERKPVWVIRDTRRLDRPISKVRQGAAAALARYHYSPRIIHPVVTSTTFLLDLIVPQAARP